MCYLYMNMMEEKMQDISTYVNGDLRADVIYDGNSYGCKLYNSEGTVVKTEFYKGHSESYAEDAAENYVFGIKKI